MTSRRAGAIGAALIACTISVVSVVGGCSTALDPPPLHARAPDDVVRLTGGAPLTAITFFSAHCKCQRAHDDRLKKIFADFAPRGVRFVMIDSEADASPDLDGAESRARGYPFSILSDPDGRFADLLGAEYATYTVVVDARGTVRYHGGLDSDRDHLSSDARPWLRDALDALLRGDEPADADPKTLGCSLRRR